MNYLKECMISLKAISNFLTELRIDTSKTVFTCEPEFGINGVVRSEYQIEACLAPESTISALDLEIKNLQSMNDRLDLVSSSLIHSHCILIRHLLNTRDRSRKLILNHADLDRHGELYQAIADNRLKKLCDYCLGQTECLINIFDSLSNAEATEAARKSFNISRRYIEGCIAEYIVCICNIPIIVVDAFTAEGNANCRTFLFKYVEDGIGYKDRSSLQDQFDALIKDVVPPEMRSNIYNAFDAANSLLEHTLLEKEFNVLETACAFSEVDGYFPPECKEREHSVTDAFEAIIKTLRRTSCPNTTSTNSSPFGVEAYMNSKTLIELIHSISVQLDGAILESKTVDWLDESDPLCIHCYEGYEYRLKLSTEISEYNFAILGANLEKLSGCLETLPLRLPPNIHFPIRRLIKRKRVLNMIRLIADSEGVYVETLRGDPGEWPPMYGQDDLDKIRGLLTNAKESLSSLCSSSSGEELERILCAGSASKKAQDKQDTALDPKLPDEAETLIVEIDSILKELTVEHKRTSEEAVEENIFNREFGTYVFFTDHYILEPKAKVLELTKRNKALKHLIHATPAGGMSHILLEDILLAVQNLIDHDERETRHAAPFLDTGYPFEPYPPRKLLGYEQYLDHCKTVLSNYKECLTTECGSGRLANTTSQVALARDIAQLITKDMQGDAYKVGPKYHGPINDGKSLKQRFGLHFFNGENYAIADYRSFLRRLSALSHVISKNTGNKSIDKATERFSQLFDGITQHTNFILCDFSEDENADSTKYENVIPPEAIALRKTFLEALSKLESAFRQTSRIGDESNDINGRIGSLIEQLNAIDCDPSLKQAISATLREINLCYINDCHIASIALTGRITEACLKHILASSYSLNELNKDHIKALWNKINKHKETKLKLEASGITEAWVDVIYTYRNIHVHDKTSEHPYKSPSSEQALSAIAACIDLLKRTYQLQ